MSQRAADCLWEWPKARRTQVRLPRALHRLAPVTTGLRRWAPKVLPTRKEIGYSYPELSSFVVFIASHIVNPGFYSLFPAGKGAQDSNVLFEWVDFRSSWPDHGAIFLHHKLDAVARGETKAFTDFLRNGNLAFTADGTRFIHLYFNSLQERYIV